MSLALLVLVGCRSHPEIPVNDEQSLVMESSLLAAGISAESPSFRHLIFNLQHPQRFITKGKNPLPFIIVFTGMTPEGWRCILWKGHAALPFPHIRRSRCTAAPIFWGRTKSDFIYICKG